MQETTYAIHHAQAHFVACSAKVCLSKQDDTGHFASSGERENRGRWPPRSLVAGPRHQAPKAVAGGPLRRSRKNYFRFSARLRCSLRWGSVLLAQVFSSESSPLF